MEAENFFARWSRRKAEAASEAQTRPDADIAGTGTSPSTAPPEEAPLPTLADADRLTPDSDFSTFIARGVDKAVRRKALKTLFSDPHFNVMDGLDIYIDDYNRVEPLPAAILAKLSHVQSVLNPVPLGRPAPSAPAVVDAADPVAAEVQAAASEQSSLPPAEAETPTEEEPADTVGAIPPASSSPSDDTMEADGDRPGTPGPAMPDAPTAPMN